MDSTEDKKEKALDAEVSQDTEADTVSLTNENTEPNAVVDSNPLSGAGALLRSLREQAGISASILASGLKVSVRKIEALEGERWQDLPDLVFARALTASFCRYLRVDKTTSEKVLSLMPGAVTSEMNLVSASDAGVEMPSSQKKGVGKLSGKTLLTLFVILLLALVVYFFPSKSMPLNWSQWIDNAFQTQITEKTNTSANVTEVGAVATEEQVVSIVSVDVGVVEQSVPAATNDLTSTFSTKVDTKQAILGLENPAQAEIQKVPVTEQAKNEVQDKPLPESTLADGDSVLKLKVNEESWISISEITVDGQSTDRLLQSGESMSLPKGFALPVEVVVGNARATQAEVRGKILDLETISRRNVARFEVE